MQTFRYTIQDELGIHARPAGLFVKEASEFPCKITVSKDKKFVNAKSILAVMGLGAKCGQEIVITAEGPQEEAAVTRLKAFLEENL